MVFQIWSKEPSREVVLAENRRLVAEEIEKSISNKNAEIEIEKNKLHAEIEKERIRAKLIYGVVLIGNYYNLVRKHFDCILEN